MRLHKAFTLIELLVVVAIIITLLAILGPSMRSAMMLAQQTRCLANQRQINLALNSYATDNLGTYPSRVGKDNHWADAYGWRRDHPYGGSTDRNTAGFGLLVSGGFLAPEGLGGLIHCPSFDNTASTVAPGHCSDVRSNWGYGGSGWIEFPGFRILGSYNYRGCSFEQQVQRPIKLSDGADGFVMVSDTADLRFRGPQSQFNEHGGYNRVFGDGSGGFWEDKEYIVDSIIQDVRVARATIDGRGNLGHGLNNPRGGSLDEAVYTVMAKEEWVDIATLPRRW